MTDQSNLKVLCRMLNEAGVIYQLKDFNENWPETPKPTYEVRISEGEGPKNLGYSSFFTSFFFDADGKLLSAGAWER